MNNTLILLVFFVFLPLINSQCASWSGDAWEEDSNCETVHDPSPDSEILVAFKGTRDLMASPAECFDPAICVTEPPVIAKVVTYDSCRMEGYKNRAWRQGWCLVEEIVDYSVGADHQCTQYKHGRQAYIPDVQTLNSFSNIIDRWDNQSLAADFSNEIPRWYIGLEFFVQPGADINWWRWKLSNGDKRSVYPLGRNTYLPWGNNEPNNNGGNENCGVYDGATKKLADYDCNSGRAVLCEYPVCRNNHRKCNHWARRGECDKNPQWMYVHCQKSCFCDCNDKNRKCLLWEHNGDCENNKVWMTQYCKKRCKRC